jgi:hypothetical protein
MDRTLRSRTHPSKIAKDGAANQLLRPLLLVSVVAGGTLYLLYEGLHLIPTIAGLATYAFVLFLLRGHKMLVSALFTITMGVLLIMSWLKDNTGGLAPSIYTVVFAFSVYDVVVSTWRRKRLGL